jgi:hypothetical protein
VFVLALDVWPHLGVHILPSSERGRYIVSGNRSRYSTIIVDGKDDPENFGELQDSAFIEP